WSTEPMVTQDLDFVVAAEAVESAVAALHAAGFRSEKFEWSVNFKGDSKVAMQLSTEEFYRDFPARAVAADVHGILLRVAALEDTLRGKMKAWSDTARRQSKRMKDLSDIARLTEAHPELWERLSEELQARIERPKQR
ncbi:MAG TPA: nucleotidyl transferase AbiEii/AbiGii toxin family protein, partial [Chthoniobacterales bacterium]